MRHYSEHELREIAGNAERRRSFLWRMAQEARMMAQHRRTRALRFPDERQHLAQQADKLDSFADSLNKAVHVNGDPAQVGAEVRAIGKAVAEVMALVRENGRKKE